MKVPMQILFLLVLTIATTTNAGDWTHWRGPEQNGVSREKGLGAAEEGTRTRDSQHQHHRPG